MTSRGSQLEDMGPEFMAEPLSLIQQECVYASPWGPRKSYAARLREPRRPHGTRPAAQARHREAAGNARIHQGKPVGPQPPPGSISNHSKNVRMPFSSDSSEETDEDDDDSKETVKVKIPAYLIRGAHRKTEEHTTPRNLTRNSGAKNDPVALSEEEQTWLEYQFRHEHSSTMKGGKHQLTRAQGEHLPTTKQSEHPSTESLYEYTSTPKRYEHSLTASLRGYTSTPKRYEHPSTTKEDVHPVTTEGHEHRSCCALM